MESFEPEVEAEEVPYNTPLFERGFLEITPGAIELLAEYKRDPHEFLARHISGDWGDMSAEDKAENDFSVDKRLRIFSSYNLSEAEKLWIITEADRRATTLLRPDEY